MELVWYSDLPQLELIELNWQRQMQSRCIGLKFSSSFLSLFTSHVWIKQLTIHKASPPPPPRLWDASFNLIELIHINWIGTDVEIDLISRLPMAPEFVFRYEMTIISVDFISLVQRCVYMPEKEVKRKRETERKRKRRREGERNWTNGSRSARSSSQPCCVNKHSCPNISHYCLTSMIELCRLTFSPWRMCLSANDLC